MKRYGQIVKNKKVVRFGTFIDGEYINLTENDFVEGEKVSISLGKAENNQVVFSTQNNTVFNKALIEELQADLDNGELASATIRR